jgi:hypothetical protein
MSEDMFVQPVDEYQAFEAEFPPLSAAIAPNMGHSATSKASQASHQPSASYNLLRAVPVFLSPTSSSHLPTPLNAFGSPVTSAALSPLLSATSLPLLPHMQLNQSSGADGEEKINLADYEFEEMDEELAQLVDTSFLDAAATSSASFTSPVFAASTVSSSSAGAAGAAGSAAQGGKPLSFAAIASKKLGAKKPSEVNQFPSDSSMSAKTAKPASSVSSRPVNVVASSVSASSPISSAFVAPTVQQVAGRICPYFLQGNCRFGSVRVDYESRTTILMCQ